MRFCRNCGESVADSDRFCQRCGTRIETGQPGELVPVEPAKGKESQLPVKTAEHIPAKGKGKNLLRLLSIQISRRWLLLGGIGVLALTVIIIVLGLAFGGGSTGPSYAFYLKDNQLNFSDFSGEPVEISQHFLGGYNYIENEDLQNVGEDLAYFIHRTEDGSKLFYPDRIGRDDGYNQGYDLYWRDLKKPDQEPEKIDSGVRGYFVTKNGKALVYLKNDDTLYSHDLKKGKVLAEDVHSFIVADDGGVIFYRDLDDGLWVIQRGKEARQMDEDVETVYHISQDGQWVLYGRDSGLYRWTPEDGAEKLSGDTGFVTAVAEDGSFYYVTMEERPLLDFIDYDVEDSYWKNYIQDYTIPMSTLSYVDSDGQILLARNIHRVISGLGGDGHVVIYVQWEEGDRLVKMSDVIEAYNQGNHSVGYTADSMVQQKLDRAGCFAAIGGETYAMRQRGINSMQLDREGKILYFLADYDSETATGTLYKAGVSDGLGKAERVEEDVFDSYWRAYLQSGTLAYYKDVDNGQGTLYIGGEEVDRDVRLGSMEFRQDSGRYYYMIDWDAERGEGTLRCFDGRKARDVADDVRKFVVTPGGEALYLHDYSRRNFEGDLYRYDGKKSQLIDEDVVDVFPFPEVEVHQAYTI